MDLGHGHRQAVIVMYVWSALAAGAGLGFTFLKRSDLIFVFPVAVGAIANTACEEGNGQHHSEV